MSVNLTVLKNEITNDPKGLGYAAYVQSGADGSIAELMNATTGSGIDTISLLTVPKGTFLLDIVAPAAIALATATPAIQTKWDRVISVLMGAPDLVDVGSATIQSLLTQAMADGLITQSEIDAVCKRQGSRSEVLFGANTVVDHIEIAVALRGNG